MSIYTSLAKIRRPFTAIVVLLFFLATSPASFAQNEQPGARISSPAASVPNAVARYGQLALSFVPNMGQSEAVVHYQAHAMGGLLFFEDDAVVLSIPAAGRDQQTENPHRTVVQLHFDGVDDARQVVHAERQPGIVNYFIGNNPARWHTNLPTYAGIIYRQLYPGIDLRYDGAEMTLKGTYTLAPQADPSLIRWHYDGAASTRVDKQTGDLLLSLGDGSTLLEKAPSAWQMSDGARVSVTVQYALMKDNSFGFMLGNYDTNKQLTIDPLLIYSTYLGGSSFDGAKSVAVDFAGNAYITGATQSTDFPTNNATFSTLNGDQDAFVVKINPAGTALIFATYLGGSSREDDFGSERAGGIAVDSSGYAYVTGCTNSANFPMVNPIQGTHGPSANCDVFVTKLNTAGNELIYSTFLGGSGADSANAIAVDDQGNAYIAGDAGKGFPGNTFTSSTHVFVSKINPEGSAIMFSMFLGGNSFEYATDVAVDSAHNVYVVGNTFSTDFPLVNAAQPTKGGGSSTNHDAFVTKINADGSTLMYSTYLGGSKTDEAAGIALDDLGNTYITGVTQSMDFPTLNAYQSAYGGERGDTFVTKLNPAGDAFIYSTYLGGSSDENYFSGHGPYGGIAVDSRYNATVTGYTCSADFPTLGSFRKGNAGTCFAFITRFSAAGNTLVFSTLIGTQSGGLNDTLSTDIALDAQDFVYIVGETYATDLLTQNPLQPSYAGLSDAFVTKLDPRFYLLISPIMLILEPTASLQITSPTGTEQWQQGTTHTITWTQNGLSGNVTLQLFQGASLASQIGTVEATAGSFAWTIPSNQAIRNDYRIRIFQGSVEDYSDANFFIVSVRKYDLLGSWSSGVSSRNSDTGEWNLITSSAAGQIAAGDMDSDGKADLVGNYLESGLWVKYSSTGQWHFIASSPTWIAVGDMNGDGSADLVGIWGGNVWLRDSATGSWTSITSGTSQIAAGDMDGDGKADLVVNKPDTGVWVQYSSTEKWVNLNPSPVSWIAVGDFNADGKADLAEIYDGTIWIKDSETGVVTNVLSGSSVIQIAAGDMDGDGKADLVGNFIVTGVWVQYSTTGTWSSLTASPASWIATGLLR